MSLSCRRYPQTTLRLERLSPRALGRQVLRLLEQHGLDPGEWGPHALRWGRCQAGAAGGSGGPGSTDPQLPSRLLPASPQRLPTWGAPGSLGPVSEDHRGRAYTVLPAPSPLVITGTLSEEQSY